MLVLGAQALTVLRFDRNHWTLPAVAPAPEPSGARSDRGPSSGRTPGSARRNHPVGHWATS